MEPELSACVETKAKQQYDQILGELLKKVELVKKGEGGDAAEKLEILRSFLESTDFSKLRREYEKYLLEDRKVKFILYSVKGKPEYEIKII